MNILHISRQFYPCIGGTEKYIYEISKRLLKKSINCRVLTLNYNIFNKKQKFAEYENFEGIEIFRIYGVGYYKKPIPLRLPLNLFKWADIVHIHDLRFLYETSLLLKQFFRYKIILSTHGFLLHTQNLKLIKSLVIPMYYKPTIENFIDAVICISKQDFKYFNKWDIKNLFLIENGIDFEKFNKIKRKPEQGNFLYFGRIDVNKGLDLLFRTLADIKDLNWQLNIVGSGFKKTVNDLKRLAYELDILKKIFWHGFLTESELFKLLSRSHICFFSSRYEGFGFSLIEAMATGNICLANNIPAFRYIIDNKKDGFLMNFSKSDVISKKIRFFLCQPMEKNDDVSKFAKEKAKNYEWENKIREIEKVYQRVWK